MLSGVIWKPVGIGATVLLVVMFALFLRVDHLRGKYKTTLETVTAEAGVVVAALREASDNPKLGWDQAPGQIVALGESNRTLKVAITTQNTRIDEMAREAVQMRAAADQLTRIAERAEAQRRAALNRLSDMAATPGTRSDCMILLREAEDALDLVREAGL